MQLEPCVPPRWARTGHAQTIMGHLLPSPRLTFKGERIEIPLNDGDRLVAFYQAGESNTLVYLFHGLAGSTDSLYMHRTAILARRQGHGVMMVNHRGCGEGQGLASGPYHSGRAGDLAATIDVGRARFPRHRHVAIGFSLSGNAVLLLASEAQPELTRPDAAIVVNAPIELDVASRELARGLNRIYDIKFYRQCRRDVWASGAALALKQRIPPLTTIYEFDDIYTAPAGGFVNREDYYARCSTRARIKNIRLPTVILTTEDDPFVPFASYANLETSNAVRLHVELVGGHMGYLSRDCTPFGTRRWQDYALDEILRQV